MLESELELEGLGEFEDEFEAELEEEYESELESELEEEDELEAEDEYEYEGEYEDELESELEDESEGEFEDELEGEFEFEGLNPISKIYPDAMMEHLGAAAMEAESEDEAAEHFLPLIPLAASKLLPLAAKVLPKIAGKALPKIARVVARATPQMTRAVGRLTKSLYRNPQTRRLVRAIPSVARRAVTTIAKHAAAGRRITPRHAVRILAREHRRVLHNPRILRAVLRRSRKMDHKLRPFGHRHHLHGRHLHAGHWGGGAGPRYARGGYPVAQGSYPVARGGGVVCVPRRYGGGVRYGRGVGGVRSVGGVCPSCGVPRPIRVRRSHLCRC